MWVLFQIFFAYMNQNKMKQNKTILYLHLPGDTSMLWEHSLEMTTETRPNAARHKIQVLDAPAT